MDELPPFRMTPRAIEAARRKLEQAPGERRPVGLRVGVAGGGCAGYRYVFDFAYEVRPERDLLLRFEDVQVVVDRRSVRLLRGATLDWEQKLLRHGFVWHNPNAKAGCGCGVSFDLESETQQPPGA